MDAWCWILPGKVAKPTQLTLKRRAQMCSLHTLIQTSQPPFFLMPGITLGILNLGRGELHLVLAEARVTLRMPD